MKFILEINMSGSAFDGDSRDELNRVMVTAIHWIDELGEPLQVGDTKRLLDINGNTCGYWKVTNGHV